jgi:hypothetical protein
MVTGELIHNQDVVARLINIECGIFPIALRVPSVAVESRNQCAWCEIRVAKDGRSLPPALRTWRASEMPGERHALLIFPEIAISLSPRSICNPVRHTLRSESPLGTVDTCWEEDLRGYRAQSDERL